MIEVFDNSKTYTIDHSGDLFWSIGMYGYSSILPIYPKWMSWFHKKVIPDLGTGNRVIYAYYHNSIFAGYMVLKHDEQKICTLQIVPEYRRKNYGRELMTLALQQLHTPIITVSDTQLDLYTGFLSEFNFSLIDTINDAYVRGHKEYVFKRNI